MSASSAMGRLALTIATAQDQEETAARLVVGLSKVERFALRRELLKQAGGAAVASLVLNPGDEGTMNQVSTCDGCSEGSSATFNECAVYGGMSTSTEHLPVSEGDVCGETSCSPDSTKQGFVRRYFVETLAAATPKVVEFSMPVHATWHGLELYQRNGENLGVVTLSAFGADDGKPRHQGRWSEKEGSFKTLDADAIELPAGLFQVGDAVGADNWAERKQSHFPGSLAGLDLKENIGKVTLTSTTAGTVFGWALVAIEPE